MKRHSSTASLALAVLAVVGLAGPALAEDQVPFKGRFAGDVTVTGAPPILSADVEGGGTATHLGRITVDIPHCVDVRTRTAAGYYEFTAANGDTVYAKFTGTATPTATPGVLYIEETATILGGTGRFAGATGSFTSERLYDTVAGTTIGSFKGTISAPGDDDDD
jgi:hypothetical protein